MTKTYQQLLEDLAQAKGKLTRIAIHIRQSKGEEADLRLCMDCIEEEVKEYRTDEKEGDNDE